MNKNAENTVYIDRVAYGDTVTRPSLGYGAKLAIMTAIGVLVSALFVYVPLWGTDFDDVFIASAAVYADSFSFSGTFSGVAKSALSHAAKVLPFWLCCAAAPTVIFRRKLLFASAVISGFLSSASAFSVLRSGAALYPTVAASALGAASLVFFIYTAYVSLSFGDEIHKSRPSFAQTANFSLRILSALGSFVIFEIIILTPSAFI